MLGVVVWDGGGGGMTCTISMSSTCVEARESNTSCDRETDSHITDKEANARVFRTHSTTVVLDNIVGRTLFVIRGWWLNFVFV